jgi:hypothetical protein
VSAFARARLVFWAIVAGVLVLLALAFALPTQDRDGFGWLVPLAAVEGGMATAIVAAIRRAPLRAVDGPDLARRYLARMMLGSAVAETPVAIGFAGTLVAGEPWPALLGGAWGIVALSLVAPTQADLDRRQGELVSAGSPLSIRDALGARPG